MLGKQYYLRREVLNKKLKFSIKHAVTRFILSFLIALLIAFFPNYSGLSNEANLMLFILIFSALLWMTEAIPAFAVSFLLISLEILLLGFPDFNFNDTSKD